MTNLQNRQLAELLHAFYSIDPSQMDELVENRWYPFVDSLGSDTDKVFALNTYFELVGHNFSRFIIYLGQLSDDELSAFRPLLSSFRELEDAYRAAGAS